MLSSAVKVVIFAGVDGQKYWNTQGLSQDWEFRSPKNIFTKGWVCKIFARYVRYLIAYIFTSFAAQRYIL